MRPTGELFFSVLRAPFGPLTVVAGPRGLRAVHIGNPDTLDGGLRDAVVSGPRHASLSVPLAQLREYLAGTRTRFDLRLDLVGTPFQVDVWRSLRRVPYGCTASYADQARSLGRPNAVRAVGSANGRNPVPIVLPCHRIVASDGTLGGYSGGLQVKEWLLAHEQRAKRGAPRA
ncbi:MAG: methylated-DNA--[protein]-cysteine S-methyltransferase [Acidimicrobiales bacterium]